MSELKTERLLLKPIALEDAESIFELRSNPEVNEYISREKPNNLDEIKDFVIDRTTHISNKKLYYWTIRELQSQKFMGTVCLWNLTKQNAEIGYELLPDYHGNGFMTEAMKAVVDFGFINLGLFRIDAFTKKDNLSSIKLLERYGFKLNPSRKDKDVQDNLIFELYRIKLLGVAYDQNSSYQQGSALAPAFIRLMDAEGSANRYCERGKEIVPLGNFFDLGDLNLNRSEAEEAYLNILNNVENNISKFEKLICFGGDHSVSYPIIEAHSKVYPELHVLHIDAHADLYENFEENPYSHASPFARLLEKKSLKSLTQVGIRTLNDHQRAQASKYEVSVIEMKDFNFDFIENLKGPLYISLDLDGLDPAFAPGVSHHEPGGLSTRQVIEIIQKIKVPIVGADIVELNPRRDLNNMTAMVAYKLFKELTSKMMD